MRRFGLLLIWWSETSRPQGPDQTWVADLTYILTGSVFPYLAVLLDAFSRQGGPLGYEGSPEDSAGARCVGDSFVAGTSTERDPSF